jgi:UDP-N-acetylmuramate--alanine ligase
MNLEHIHRVFFLGIGGIGMSALAKYFLHQGLEVAGYDRTRTELTEGLTTSGAAIHYEDKAENLPNWFSVPDSDDFLVVFTPAIPTDSEEFLWFKSREIPLYKRALVLASIVNPYTCVAVAGTHGKTTTSSLIAHILSSSGHGCNAFLGGIIANYESNVILDEGATTAVVEADEFDRSFLTLEPSHAVITSMDADHLDIYHSGEALSEAFKDFAKKVKPGGLTLTKYGLPLQGIETMTYGLDSRANYAARDIEVIQGRFVFSVDGPQGLLGKFELPLPGRHNVENATAAIAMASHLGVKTEAIQHALKGFKGIYRRFDIHINTPELAYVDDYAHHPTEITAAIDAARELFPSRKISVVFQPHLYSRTRDFAAGFALALSLADEVILLPIYPAREKPIDGVDSQMLLNKILHTPKIHLSKSDLLVHLKNNVPDVLLTLGAGDIDTLVKPISKLLK